MTAPRGISGAEDRGRQSFLLRHRADLLACAGLCALWLIPIAIVGIHGDFPISDDFAYAFSTRTLVETGRIERLAWTWVPLVSHVAVGAAASTLFGFSFETLRGSTLLMGPLLQEKLTGSLVAFVGMGDNSFLARLSILNQLFK